MTRQRSADRGLRRGDRVDLQPGNADAADAALLKPGVAAISGRLPNDMEDLDHTAPDRSIRQRLDDDAGPGMLRFATVVALDGAFEAQDPKGCRQHHTNDSMLDAVHGSTARSWQGAVWNRSVRGSAARARR